MHDIFQWYVSPLMSVNNNESVFCLCFIHFHTIAPVSTKFGMMVQEEVSDTWKHAWHQIQAYFPTTSSVGGVWDHANGIAARIWEKTLSVYHYKDIGENREHLLLLGYTGKPKLSSAVARIGRVDSARMVKCTISSTLLGWH
jgi:hypothetical protein